MTNNDEQRAWASVEGHAKTAIGRVETWLDLRMGAKNDQALDNAAKARLLCIVRAVSWVESKHGTYRGGNHGDRDPLQCGNPNDVFWRSITGQLGDGDRFVRGPRYTGSEGAYWARELGGRYDADASPASRLAALGDLAAQRRGHANERYSPPLSYAWGVLYLVHRTNTAGGGEARSYKCGAVDWGRLIAGAVAYNGGGVDDYRGRIESALNLSGCKP